VSHRLGIEEQIELAVEVLRRGGIVAFPTDTVYGLGADASNEQAIAKIFRVKRRPGNLPLPLLLSDKSDITKVASIVPDIARRLADRFLPGGLTLVLSKGKSVSSAVTAGGDTVAVRVPDHHVPVDIIRRLGAPLVGTSANLSGKPAPTTAEEVRAQLGGEVDLVIDGGRCPGGVESTVVDVSGDAPVLVREGAVPWEEIAKFCGASSLTPNENEV
jgi:L-threonylcarbamoyladenylate synthase